MNISHLFLFLFIGINLSIVNAKYCNQCLTMVGAVENWVQKGTTEQQIEKNLDVICSKIPAFGPICEQLVKNELPQWIKSLERRESPQKICSSFKFCPTNSTLHVNLMAMGNDQPKTLKCEACDYLIGAIVAYVDQSTQPSDIKNMVKELCQLVKSFEMTCDALALENIEKIFDWVFSNYNSQAICTKLGVCEANTVKTTPAQEPTKSTCLGCKIVVEEAQIFLRSSDKIPAIVKAASNKVCHLLQAKYRDTCNAFIQMEEPSMIDLLASQDSQKVCKKVGLC